jgi:hypothetical protein
MRTGGIATVSILVMLTVGTAIGALVGLFLGHTFQHPIAAVVAGMAGTFVAVIAQNALVHRQIGVGTDEEPIPMVIMVCGLIAAVAASLGGLELASLLHEPFPVWIGTMAGLLSSVVMGLITVAYHAP